MSPEEKLAGDLSILIKGIVRKIPIVNRIDTRSLAYRIARISQSYVEAKLNEKHLEPETETAESEVVEQSVEQVEC
jgi:hypothetical protein